MTPEISEAIKHALLMPLTMEQQELHLAVRLVRRNIPFGPEKPGVPYREDVIEMLGLT